MARIATQGESRACSAREDVGHHVCGTDHIEMRCLFPALAQEAAVRRRMGVLLLRVIDILPFISGCPNRPIHSSREVRCHNVTGRCLVFRKHLQYPAVQMLSACRIVYGSPAVGPGTTHLVDLCVLRRVAIEGRACSSGEETLYKQLTAAFIPYYRLHRASMQTLGTW